MKKTITMGAALAALAAFSGGARAQMPPPPPPAPPPVRRTLGSLIHRARPNTPGVMSAAGQVVGNKKTHVYHLAGDKGALPAAQNRVYFPTEAAAASAGYRRAGTAHGTRPHQPRMHGSPRRGTPMHRMPGQPPAPPAPPPPG